MSDDPTSWFAEAAHALREAVEGAAERSLQQRVERIVPALGALYLAALHLPPGPPPSLAPVPLPDDWPGLGAYERYEAIVEHAVVDRTLTDDLALIHGEVAAGLAVYAVDPGAAAAWWRAGFERRWGSALLLALRPLHRALLAFRDRPPPRRGPTVPEIVPLAPPKQDARPVLGVRLADVDGGVEVVEVHPEGPAAGRLRPGDALLSIDGEPVGGLTADEVLGQLVGGADAPRPGGRRLLEVWRDEGSVTVELTIGGSGAPRAQAGRTVRVLVSDREATARATQALRLLGCRITSEGDVLRVEAPASLPDDDLRALLEAGRRAGAWSPA